MATKLQKKVISLIVNSQGCVCSKFKLELLEIDWILSGSILVPQEGGGGGVERNTSVVVISWLFQIFPLSIQITTTKVNFMSLFHSR